ncbi:hypothetical protein RJ639_005282, partial [Escallonia herrerae]
TFRALVESADRKFARVRDAPAYGRGPNRYFHKVFKAYMRLWKYQQENRAVLVEAGLQRWEIGEIASRIGQLYFGQYTRTSEARFLLESYIFYEAIFNRGYFEGSKDRGVRFKELRFYARFLLVALILNRWEMVKVLVERFKALVHDSRANFRETNFKEWKQVVQEIIRFIKVDAALMNTRTLRYCSSLDSYPASLPHVARFHAKKVLKFRDALLTSYHRNEVKYAELTLDTFRMLQCLEWEPSGSFYKKHQTESRENGASSDYSGTSGLIDINLVADMTDPTLPANPRKVILHRPSVTQLIAVIATICEELPPDSVMLIYLSASGKSGHSNLSQSESSGSSKKSSKLNVLPRTFPEQNNSRPGVHVNGKGESALNFENSLWFQLPLPWRHNSFYQKALHGAERGETAALLLSPSRPTFKRQTDIDETQIRSQFTLFLTAPLQAFCQMVGLTCSDTDVDVYGDADNIISAAFSGWEMILCSSTSLDLVWAQVLSDPFLRRLILRFIFCRAVLAHYCPREDSDQHVPFCLPELPNSMSPNSEAVQSAIIRLAGHLKVADYFHFDGS